MHACFQPERYAALLPGARSQNVQKNAAFRCWLTVWGLQGVRAAVGTHPPCSQKGPGHATEAVSGKTSLEQLHAAPWHGFQPCTCPSDQRWLSPQGRKPGAGGRGLCWGPGGRTWAGLQALLFQCISYSALSELGTLSHSPHCAQWTLSQCSPDPVGSVRCPGIWNLTRLGSSQGLLSWHLC